MRKAGIARRRYGIVSAVLAVTLLSTVAATAQTGGPVASGSFQGSIGVDGGFRADLSGAEIVVLIDGGGPLQLELDEGQMSGSWSFDGSQTLSGNFAEGEVSGQGSFTANGTIGGPPADYRLTGTYTSTNTATFSIAGLSQSATTTDSGSLDEQLTDVIVLCDQIVGRWDLRVRQEIESVGFDEFIRGYFTASTGVDATEQGEKVEELLADINTWASRASSLPTGDTTNATSLDAAAFDFILDGWELLWQAQDLQAQLAVESPCPPDPRFATQLTLAAQDVANTFLDLFPGTTNSHLVGLALGTGAIGSGSPVPDAAAQLESRLEADVAIRWERVRSADALAPAEVGDVARAAQMLGIETLPGGLSPAEVLLTLGDA